MIQLFRMAFEEVAAKARDGEPDKIIPKDDQVLICKNNVCVHPTDSGEHVPGYFKLKLVRRPKRRTDLSLRWVPNTLMTADLDDDGTPTKTQDWLNENKPLRNNKSAEGSNNTNSDLSSDLECFENTSLDDPQSTTAEQKEIFSAPLGGVFNINLSEMKSIKVFYEDEERINGQLIIINAENQYKIFHFHFGGINKIVEHLAGWNGCKEEKRKDCEETNQRLFMILKDVNAAEKTETGLDVHPEENIYSPLSLKRWKSLLNPLGQIKDVNGFRKHVFFSGVNGDLRKEVWKFLLYYYPLQSTSFERDSMKKEKENKYKKIHEERLALTGDVYENFCRRIQSTVDKDVIRTDRNHPYFCGDSNPNIEKMRNILLNYAVFNEDMGYTQGMSDLLAPLLATFEDEVDSFWCFVGLMELSLFATTPKDDSMDKSLGFLRELLRVMYPEFYIHCLMQDEELSLLFCHRWLVLCFKREFLDDHVLTIWEACWSRYQTDYFHIFICVAILRLHGNRCIEKKMRMDEMMQYFMDLALMFDADDVLIEARSLLHKFRTFQVIPCTLEDLLCGPGAWDGGIQPDVQCVSRRRKCCIKQV